MGNTLMSLLVKIGADTSQLREELDKAEGVSERSAGKIQSGLASIGGAIVLGGLAAAGAATVALGGFLVTSVKAASDAEDIQAQLGAVLKSTGGAAGVTAKQVNDLATSLGNATKFEDDVIVSGENMLLTFTNIGKNVFPAATETMLDMAQAMGGDLQGTAIQLGKALNDPTKGISALTRVGVTFTDKQKALIESLQKAGEMEEAQAVILKELQTEFGGAAKAAGATFAGKLAILQHSLGNIQETIGGALLPILTEMAGKLVTWLNDPQIQAGIASITAGIAKLAQDAVAFIPVVVSWFQQLGQWFMDNQGVIVGILAAIGVAVGVFVWSTVIPAITALIIEFAPVILVMAVIAGAAYLLYKAWTTNFGGIQQIVAAVWAWLQPVFQQLKAWLEVNIPIALQTLSDFWTNTLLPAILAVWAWMQANLFPLLSSLGELLGVTFTTILTALAGLWQKVLLPALQEVGKWMEQNLLPIFKTVGDWIGAHFTPAVNGIAKAFSDVKKFIDDVIAALKNIDLPPWLTPGSPTPFEIGLTGIGKAFDRLAEDSIPTFSAKISALVPPGGEGDNRTYNFNYSGEASAQQVFQSYEMARALK